LSLNSCSFLSMTDRPTQVNDLVGWVERVHVESELAKQKVNSAVALLEDIATANYQGPAVEAYSKFVTALDESEAQAEKLRGAVDPMKRSADPVFEQWETDLEGISSASIRQRSEERRTATQQRYNDVVASVDPAQESFDVLNRAMRDHALFLGNDFNPASVAMIREDVSELKRLVRELDGRFDTCLRAAQDYVNSYALPVSAAPNAAPGPEGTERTKR
jgi:tetrahydromethanopterin S-methyltransferase subunit B